MFDIAETDRLLSTTRSVRRRLDLERPVPRDVVMDCVRLAVQAPTASNSQTWRWVMVDDADQRAELARLYREMAGAFLPLYRTGALGEMSDQTERVITSAEYLADVLHQVPVLAVPCIVGRLRDTSPMSAAAMYGSVLPAVWSFQLALRSRGLGSCYTTLHLAHEAEVSALLGIPDDVTQVGLLPVAYTVGDDFKPARRGPVEEICAWNAWPA